MHSGPSKLVCHSKLSYEVIVFALGFRGLIHGLLLYLLLTGHGWAGGEEVIP